MPLTWAGLARPFSHTDSAALTALLLGATERERLAFAAEIERRIRADDEGPWERSVSPAGLFALTVIACMPTAARAAALLTRRSMRDWGRIRVDRFLAIARTRELPWLGDLGVRLAGRLPARNPDPREWEFVEALLIEGGAEPPVTDPVVRDWLDRVARREPERAAEIRETVAVALSHPSLDLQERARDVIGAGWSSAEPAEFPEVAAAPPAAPMPPPIGSAAELAEELMTVAHTATAVRWERVMAGLVTLHHAGALSGVPAEVLRALRGSWDDGLGFLGRALSGVTGPAPELAAFNVPADVLTWRLAELAVRLPGGLPVLLATPTDVSGCVEAGTLVERMERLEAAGRDPWPLDFEQALLRVAVTGDAAVLARAGALSTPEGKRLAAWFGAERVETIATRIEQPGGGYGYDAWTPFDAGPELIRRVVVNLAPRRDDRRLPLLGRLLFTIGRRPTAREDCLSFHHCPPDVLAMTLPHDREAVAAWALPEIAGLADRDSRDDTALPLLGDCSGRSGAAVALALAYGLGARHQPGRAAAVDSYLAVTAGTGPLPAAVGADLGDLCADGTVKLTRVVPALADAHAAGASVAVWETIAAALPPLLKATPRGLPDLLELATRVTSRLGTRAEVPGLDAVAGRGGGARLTREAKRLHATVTR
ncbi:hypothetical protein KZ829_38835 [Actinoplanes hulinensis]|uniref:Secreted protein n=1 Tax=Actinoplanes hulinensis TaxID=1144547 RepID=A0ABS7BFV2_9ACTN|nr:hypothetical protein [Actinoplanes hulinensis]MBW6439702.1 hypothetical protein [Actinoplanes hulinensis]